MSSKADLRAAILIVSTTAAKDPASDASEAVLRDVFNPTTEGGGGAAAGGQQWTVSASAIVSDDVVAIQRQLTAWTDGTDPAQTPHLIVTTGGTGFATSDQTPEAVTPLLDRQAPGLVHAMLAASLAVTPFAAMSRPVAGVRRRTVVLTLPGSPKGARENLLAVLRLLPHACLQAAGADSRALHAGGVRRLEAEAGVGSGGGGGSSISTHRGHDHNHSHSHSHSHAHGHAAPVRHTTLSNDPALGPSSRHRESPYPMLTVDDALALIRQHTPALEAVTHAVDPSLVGAVLAEDVHAREDVPAFRASIVDGYAVVVPAGGDMRGVFPVVAVSHAAPGGGGGGGVGNYEEGKEGAEEEEEPELQPGSVARITTGAPLPRRATAVVMVEDTVLRARTDDGREEKEVEILAQGVRAGENVREIGSDTRAGTLLLQRGELVTASGGELGLLAAAGVGAGRERGGGVRVFRRPVMAVLSTGDELVPHDDDGGRNGELRRGQVRDTNRPTLLAAAQHWGFEAVDCGIAGDRPGALEAALRDALRRADLLVTTGGVSMGELDLLKPTIERALGGTVHFGRVAMKPGKPTTFATVPVKDVVSSSSSSSSSEDGAASSVRRVPKVVFSLPGNPASALVTFHLFVLPALHQMAGVSPPGLPRIPVTLAHDFALDPVRPEYHRAVVSVRAAADGSTLSASSTGGQRSSRVGSLRGANALLCMPSGKEPLRKGTRVDALIMGSLRSEVE